MVVDRKDSQVSSEFIIFCFVKMKNRSLACFTLITGGGWWWLVVLDLEGGSCELVSQNEQLEWCVSVIAKI